MRVAVVQIDGRSPSSECKRDATTLYSPSEYRNMHTDVLKFTIEFCNVPPPMSTSNRLPAIVPERSAELPTAGPETKRQADALCVLSQYRSTSSTLEEAL